MAPALSLLMFSRASRVSYSLRVSISEKSHASRYRGIIYLVGIWSAWVDGHADDCKSK